MTSRRADAYNEIEELKDEYRNDIEGDELEQAELVFRASLARQQ